VLKNQKGGGVKSLNDPTRLGSKLPLISWVGWHPELGGSTPLTPPSNLTLVCGLAGYTVTSVCLMRLCVTVKGLKIGASDI